jgi:hypothetical protein
MRSNWRPPTSMSSWGRDHALRAAGFDVLAYDETDDWERRQRETTSRLLEAVEELAAESASDADEVRRELEEMQATLDVIERRVFVVAERPD